MIIAHKMVIFFVRFRSRSAFNFICVLYIILAIYSLSEFSVSFKNFLFSSSLALGGSGCKLFSVLIEVKLGLFLLSSKCGPINSRMTLEIYLEFLKVVSE